MKLYPKSVGKHRRNLSKGDLDNIKHLRKLSDDKGEGDGLGGGGKPCLPPFSTLGNRGIGKD